MLSPSGHREEPVANSHGRRGHPQVLDDAELDGLEQRLVPTLRLSRARRGQEVGGVEPSETQLVRLLGLHGVQRLVGLGGSHAGGQAGPLSSADAELPDLVVHCTTLLHAPLAEQGGRRTEGQAAGGVDRASESGEKNHSLRKLNAVLVLVECEAPSPADRALGADDVGNLLDGLDGNRGDLGNLVDRILSGALFELVDAEDPVFSHLMVILVILEHEVHDAESHSGVGLRTDLDVDVAIMGANPGDARVDRDDVRTTLHHVDEAVTEETVAVGGQRLLAPNHYPLGEGVARVVVRTGQMACIVELRIASAEDVVGDGATRTVAGPTRLRVAAVGRLQDGERQSVVVNASLTAGATEADDGLMTVGLPEVTDLVDDRLDGLVPRDTLPLIFTTILNRTLHRVDDAVRMMRVLAESEVQRIDATQGNRVVVVTLDADELAILGNNLDAVSYGVGSRRRPGVAASDYGTVLKFGTPLLGISHTVTPFLGLPLEISKISVDASFASPCRLQAQNGLRGKPSIAQKLLQDEDV